MPDADGSQMPSWSDAPGEAADAHVRSFRRLVDEGLLEEAVQAAIPGGSIPAGLVLPAMSDEGHLVRDGEERVVGLRLCPRPGRQRGRLVCDGRQRIVGFTFRHQGRVDCSIYVPAFGDLVAVRWDGERAFVLGPGPVAGDAVPPLSWVQFDPAGGFPAPPAIGAFSLGRAGRRALDALLGNRIGATDSRFLRPTPDRRVPAPAEIVTLGDWSPSPAQRVVGAGELFAEAVFRHLVVSRRAATEDSAVSELVARAVGEASDDIWIAATPVDRRNPVAHVAQRRRVALPEHGITVGTGLGVFTLETSVWPGATGVRPSVQLNAGIDPDVFEGGTAGGLGTGKASSSTGLSWSASLIPFAGHDVPLAVADGARAMERAVPPIGPSAPRVGGAARGAPFLGVDVVVALAATGFGDRSVVVSSDFAASGMLDWLDYDGRRVPVAVGDVLFDRHGSGGVVAAVRDRCDLPCLSDGMPVDVLFDPIAVVGERRFGAVAELGASRTAVFDAETGLPLPAVAGVTHVLRQERPWVGEVGLTTIARAAFEAAGWTGTGSASAARTMVAVPDPVLAPDVCGLPQEVWVGGVPAAVMVLGTRAGPAVGFRAVTVPGWAVRLPSIVSSLFVRPWTGETVTVVSASDAAAAAATVISRPLDRATGQRLVAMSAQAALGLRPLSGVDDPESRVAVHRPDQVEPAAPGQAETAQAPSGWSTESALHVAMSERVGLGRATERPLDLTLAALRPSSLTEHVAEVAGRVERTESLYLRGISTAYERGEKVREILHDLGGQVRADIYREIKEQPDGLMALLARGRVRADTFVPLVIDPGGDDATPQLGDYLAGVSKAIQQAAVVPSGVVIDWPLRADALTAWLVEAARSMVVDTVDCGRPTPRSLPLPDRKHRALPVLAGPVLAQAAGDLAAGTILTASDIERLQRNGVSTLQVRSPLGCASVRGVCASCVGTLRGDSAPPAVGTPIGLVAAIGVGRVLPELWLRTFHVCGGHLPVYHGLLRVEELVTGATPDGAAVLAEQSGVVRIENGRFCVVDAGGSVLQDISRGLPRAVRSGDTVEPGDQLTSGPLPLADLARLRGRSPALSYVADDLTSILESNSANPLSLTECLVRALAPTWPWSEP